MQKAFEKIVERLEERKNSIEQDLGLYGIGIKNACDDAIKIVNQVAEEYKGNDDLISRSALLEVLNKNSIFQKVTNAEGKNVIEIINEQPYVKGE